MHILCTICSDLVNQAENIYVTKCGHIFHYNCLVQWIDRSKSCPQCRNKVTDKCMFRLFPTISNDTSGDDVTTLQSRLDDAQLQLRQQQAVDKQKDDKLNALADDLKKNQESLKACEKKLITRESAVCAMKEQILYYKIQSKEIEKIKEENETLKKNVQTLNGLQSVLQASSAEVEEMLRERQCDARTLATFAAALKRALCESENKKKESREQLRAAHAQHQQELNKNRELLMQIDQLREERQRARQPAHEHARQPAHEHARQPAHEHARQPAHEHARQPAHEHARQPAHEHARQLAHEHARQPAHTPTREPAVKRQRYDDVSTPVTDVGSSGIPSTSSVDTDTDSPYLRLTRGGALASATHTLRRHQSLQLPPSEFALLNSAKSIAPKPCRGNTTITQRYPTGQLLSTSIFHKKTPTTIPSAIDSELNMERSISYDGLGGHSKLDAFPAPQPRVVFNTCIPRVTARHKLKKPSAGCRDIGTMLMRTGAADK